MDWQAIKTEYITTDTSYRKLSKKYGVSSQAICARSKAEGWIAARERHLNETLSKTVEKISNEKAKRAAKVLSVADKLLNKIDAAADAMVPSALNAKALRSLTASVKDLKDIMSIRSDLDEMEQKARIDNLRKAADKQDNNVSELEVVFLAGEEAWNE